MFGEKMLYEKEIKDGVEMFSPLDIHDVTICGKTFDQIVLMCYMLDEAYYSYEDPVRKNSPDYKDGFLYGMLRCRNLLDSKDIEIKRLGNKLDKQEDLKVKLEDKKERIDIAIRLLTRMFGNDDYEINYIIGILNGSRQIHFDEEDE